HGYSIHNQEAMVDFFAKHAGTGPVEKVARPKDLGDKLLVTPKGEVIPAGAIPIFDLIAEKADVLAGKRKKLSNSDLKNRLPKLLTLPEKSSVPHYRVLRPIQANGNRVARYAIETENSIRAILRKHLHTLHSVTLDVEPDVHLYLPHTSAEEDLATDTLAASLKKQHPLYALDVRGLGESMPDDGGADFFQAYGIDYMNTGYGLLLGESYLGRRVHDLLATMDLLCKEGARHIHLYGRGQGAILALFGSLLHENVSSTTLKNGPLSFHAWAQVPLVSWPHASFLPGVLKEFDLPDCIRALKKVRLIQPWGPDMKPLTGQRLASALKQANLSPDLVK
ncbi:MAG: hypothetical protein O2954_17085, partial [bacterium]|nr:hypothetical protein [bacterium]